MFNGHNHQIFTNGHQSGKEMIIRTIENVNDFSDIRHSYLKNLSASTKKRQEKLLQDHYFLCECTRCLDTKSDNLKNSMKCTNCNSGCVLKLVKKWVSKGQLISKQNCWAVTSSKNRTKDFCPGSLIPQG